MKCLYCKKLLEGSKKKYCSKSHAALYNQKRRMKEINNESPETYIKKVLNDDKIMGVSNPAVMNEVTKRVVVRPGKNKQVFLTKGQFKFLGLKTDDIIDITVKVVLRN